MVLTPKLGKSRSPRKNTQMGQVWNCTSIEYTPSTLTPGFPPPEKFSSIYAMSCLKLRTIRNTFFFPRKSQPLDPFHYSQSGWNPIGFLQKENYRLWKKNPASETRYASPRVPHQNFRLSFQLLVHCEDFSFLFCFCFYINNCQHKHSSSYYTAGHFNTYWNSLPYFYRH